MVLKRKKWFLYLGIIIALLIVISAVEHFVFGGKELKDISPLGPELTNCQREFKPQYSQGPYYNGPLFDAHYHVPASPGMKSPFIPPAIFGEDLTLNEALCTFDKEKVRGALGFYFPFRGKQVSLPQAKEIKGYAKNRMQLFISPMILKSEELEQILTTNPDLFVGLGEMFYYEITNLIRPIDGKWTKEILEIAQKHNLSVMIHPSQGQLEKVEKILTNYPNTKFIFHGHELERHITDLMAKYPNVYYSVDGAVLHSMRGKMVRGPEDEYLSDFKQNFQNMLQERTSYWRDRIGRYPDRFMWGTDRSTTWNYSQQMSVLMEEFGRAFIGQLDPAVQEKYAYQNAEKLLGL